MGPKPPTDRLPAAPGGEGVRSPAHQGPKQSLSAQPSGDLDAELARLARRLTGLSRRQFGALIGATHVSISRWESGQARPTGASRSLLRLVVAEPTLVVEILSRSTLAARNAHWQERNAN